MDYLFRQHYSLSGTVGAAVVNNAPVILLAETEPEALAMYANHLNRANMLVNVCVDWSRLVQQTLDLQPHLLIINPTADIVLGISLLKRITQHHPGLPIITIGTAIPDPYLDRLMAAGVALHLNRSLTQPRDIAVAARQILGLNQ